ncbi:uncharacterized protein RJT20DRAFT_1049 [Scheffersomyces xylosifermentans]|uniref:uncharacterized protein n=1 Tax=Scheffersomyces xylosifermentans TaxID=1304137 RepID=UPI00315CA743
MPVMLILNPEMFEPPFTNAFDECFNVTNSSLLGNRFSEFEVVNYLLVGLSILLAGFDVIYSVLRLLLAGILLGLTVGLTLFFLIWVYVTYIRRWKLVILFFNDNECSGIW